MKKNLKKIASTLFVVSIFTTAMVTNTLAKYTSSANGSDNIKYAKWSVYVDEFDAQNQQTFNVNLFDTIYDSDGTTQQEFNSSTDVIAPGTCGEWSFNVKNLSEVDCTYSVTFETIQKTVTDGDGDEVPCDDKAPIEFKLDDQEWSKTLSFTTGELAGGANKDHTIKWRWAYEGNDDEIDTTLGNLMNYTVPSDFYSVKVSITFTQAD